MKQSLIQEKIVIRSKVNPDLDILRQRYNSLPKFLTDIVHEIADSIKNPQITTINVVYFPQLGFLVTIQLDGGLKAEEINEDTFDLQFITEKVAYLKDPITRRLDEEIGDIYADIVDMEVEIIRILTEQIMPHRHLLNQYGRRLAELDCLVALAQFAAENYLIRPILTEDHELEIKGGRYNSLKFLVLLY